ncbi:MAG: hypothetical protein A2096_13565 [Spirochaetes bacterium GWF1_41_5]|nr:MAG: hypothetical protein A2096_13565 [Spirochaetes bacterium GWF1_41_5]HBE03482.1 endonuclease [Spirochaetia bacterium]
MADLLKIYKKFYDIYGPQGWWPLSKKKTHARHHSGAPQCYGDRFEIIIGAILTQNTSWINVEKALHNLKKNKKLGRNFIIKMTRKKLAKLIRPSGYFNMKALKLKNAADFFSPVKSAALMQCNDLNYLRSELLAVNGIGPETCDSILLYAFAKPVFVIDAYTRRIFSRLGFIGEKLSYPEWQKFFMDNLKNAGNKTAVFNEYHAMIVAHAKMYCRTKPLCSECPLKKNCRYRQTGKGCLNS